MINLAVFASTKGTDLQAIIDETKAGKLPNINLKFALSNKKDCYALERTRQAGMKAIFLDPTGKTREEYDEECLKLCQEEEIDLILTIGYMRLFSLPFVRAYQNKIINIHPSLLPKYPGMELNVHRQVLENKESETGCTLHFVEEGMDTGKIIAQEKVTIEPGETVESLKSKVKAKEQEVIIKFLKSYA